MQIALRERDLDIMFAEFLVDSKLILLMNRRGLWAISRSTLPTQNPASFPKGRKENRRLRVFQRLFVFRRHLQQQPLHQWCPYRTPRRSGCECEP